MTALAPYADYKLVKETMGMDAAKPYLDEVIKATCLAAADAIDGTCNRSFGLSAEEDRYYTPASTSKVIVNDLVSVSSMLTDQDFDGIFEYEWTENKDFVLTPFNSPSRSEPYTRVELKLSWGVVRGFPVWTNRSVKISGIWGWPEVPASIVEAAIIISIKLLKRKREAPLGFVAAVGENAMAARIARTDPDVSYLLSTYLREEVEL